MLLLYFLGSYIRKYSLDERFDKKSLLKILIATTALNVFLNSLISIATGGKPHIPFARDCSVFIVIEAAALMMFFMKVSSIRISLIELQNMCLQCIFLKVHFGRLCK